MAHHFTRSDNLYEDLTVGETIVHPRGRTISDEHMLWTNFVLNTAQLHFNQKMCDDSPSTTFDGRRVVYGGIVFAFVAGGGFREKGEKGVARPGFDGGGDPKPGFSRDTPLSPSTSLSPTH